MKSFLSVLSFLCLVAPIHPVFAIDPGTAQGSLQVNAKTIPISQAYAHLHDNAEGLLDRPKELRIVLADREVPQETLAGIAFLPVTQMAKEGKVQGLLIQLDPNDRSSFVVTLLYPPANPGESLMAQTVSTTSQKAFKRLEIVGQRVVGEIESRDQREANSTDMPKLDYSVRFSAPLFHELAITADLKGKAAQNSRQVGVLRKKVEALGKGDFDAVRRLSSAGANRRNEAFLAQSGPKAKSFAKQAAAEMEKSIKRIQRVVVRGERAVAIFSDKEWGTFVREGTEWKSDD